MANLGDVTVTLRAEVGQFEQGLRQARQSTQQTSAAMRETTISAERFDAALEEIHRDLALMSADLRRGKLSAQEYAESMAATRQQVLGLSAGLRNADAEGIRRFNAALAASTVATDRAGITIRSLREPLTSVATSALGASGPLGSLSSVLLSLTAGSAVAVGVLAGLAAIASAMRTLTAATREAQDAYDQYMKSLRPQSALAIVGAQLDNVRQQVEDLEEAAKGKGSQGLLYNADALRAARAELVRLEAQYAALVKSLKVSARESDDATKALEDQTAAWTKLSGAMIVAQQTAVEAAAVPFFLQGQQRPTRDNEAPGYTSEAYNPAYTPTILLGARQREGLVGKVNEDAPAWKRVGADIGNIVGDGLARGIAATLLRGGKGIGDVLKNVFREIFEAIIVEIIRPFAKKIGKIIGNALAEDGGGGLLGAGIIGAGIGIVGGLFGLARASTTTPTSPTLVVPTSAIPPNPSPIAMARDAQWLALWGETARVAGRAGIRLVPA